jgi:archaellum component FlaC
VRQVVEYVTRDEFGRFAKGVDGCFARADKRFDGVDKQLVAITKRFEAVDKRFDAVDKRFEAVDKRFDAVDKRFEAVDKRFDAVDKRFDDLIAVLGETIENAMAVLRTELRKELGSDLARQIRASEERIRAEIRGVDDQYRDLPERLEAHTGLKR